MISAREWPVPSEIVAEYLIANAGVPVRWVVPSPRLPKFLVVRQQSGGGYNRWSYVAVLDVEVWAGDPGDSPRTAATIAEQVRELLIQLPFHSPYVTDASVSGAQFYADPTSGSPRYIVTASLRIKP
jgi:hypothetical protein